MISENRLIHAKEAMESKLAGLQALMSSTTDTATRDVLQEAVSDLATKLSQINAAIASPESVDQSAIDIKEEKIPIDDTILKEITGDAKNIQAAVSMFEAKKIEKETLEKEENLDAPPPKRN